MTVAKKCICESSTLISIFLFRIIFKEYFKKLFNHPMLEFDAGCHASILHVKWEWISAWYSILCRAWLCSVGRYLNLGNNLLELYFLYDSFRVIFKLWPWLLISKQRKLSTSFSYQAVNRKKFLIEPVDNYFLIWLNNFSIISNHAFVFC